VAAVAAKNFHGLGLEEVTLVVGNFDEKLEGVLKQAEHIDLAFVDGNHRLEPTLRYFHLLMSRCAPSSILIFDDIHWSAEMEEAWARIQGDPGVYMTIDLFLIGLVVLRDEFKVKQHFVIRV
jgi:predicted O-methyltransferase YrrM